MLLGPVVGADRDDWNRMIGVNIQGMLSVTHAALPHLLRAAEDSPRRVADIVNISSIAGRVFWNGSATPDRCSPPSNERNRSSKKPSPFPVFDLV